MSFVQFKREAQLEEPLPAKAAQDTRSNLSMKIDVVPIPQGATASVDLALKDKQNKAIMDIQEKGRDLFSPNQTVVSNNAGKRLYQTADLYGQTLAVEDLIPLLTESGLTLRVTAEREGLHVHHTCMELKTGVLADLLGTSPDSKREKVTELSVEANPEAGRMFVGTKLANGKHYIQKLDYELNSIEDDRLHLKQ